MADGVWKGIYPQVFGCSKQLLLNKFIDPSTPSMRKGRDRGEKNGGMGKKEEKNDENSGHKRCASRPTGTLTTRAKMQTTVGKYFCR